VRALTAAILALALLIPLIGTANAQDGAQWPPYYGNNRLCIQGRIINFDETPLPFSDLYTSDDPSTEWDIVAVSASTGVTIPVTLDLDDNGDPNADAFFTLDESDGLTTGTWTISLTIPPNSGWEAVDPYKTELTLNLDYGMKDCAKVRFKLRFPITVIVFKIDDQHNPLEGWTIRAQPAREIAKAVPLPPVWRGPSRRFLISVCWRSFVPTWRLRPSLARAIARRGHGCASFPVSGVQRSRLPAESDAAAARS